MYGCAVSEADLRAVRIIGWAMVAPGAALLLLEVAVIYDTLSTEHAARSGNVLLCAVVIGLPLFIAGLRRLLDPRRYL